MISTTLRSSEPELLDGEELNPADYETTMRELGLINKMTFGHQPTLHALDRVVRLHPELGRDRPLRVLDVGFGYGDTLRAMEKWALRRRLKVDLCGIDLNPEAAKLARAATPADSKITYAVGNAFDCEAVFGSQRRFDFIANALFMHHLNDQQVITMLEWMTKTAGAAWFINDLHRHPVAYHFIKYVTALFNFNRMIQNDAPLSVARSFRLADWQRYLSLAGIPSAAVEVRWHLSFRYGIFCDTIAARTEGRL